ncbi:unnamed protein product, partial [Brassica oleracea var. botrytis]
MVESDDQPIVTGSDDNPKVEESSVVSDEFVTETKSSRPWEKRSNNTLYVKDKQEDECGPEEVLQLVSFWNKRMWEPGGVL